jgi:hypothetical protein
MADFETLRRLGEIVGLLPLSYLGVGAVFSLVYGLFLAGRLEPAARGAPAGFRLIIMPAAALMWPMLLGRLLTKPRSGR